MHVKHTRIRELFLRWHSGQATAAEREELAKLLEGADLEKVLDPHMRALWESEVSGQILGTGEIDALVDRILEESGTVNPVPAPRSHRSSIQSLIRRFGYAAAAAILVVAGAGLWLHYGKDRSSSVELAPTEGSDAANSGNDLLPGSDKAILILSSGESVYLTDSAHMIRDAGTEILYRDGQLVYAGGHTVAYNTMATPRGGQYRLLLADGTSVWINSLSSIRYPTVFTDDERVVELTGEAYFEVKRDPRRPFRVRVLSSANRSLVTELEVLGTSFNINAYDDEPAVTTTLLAGEVRISGKILKPGQAMEGGSIREVDVSRAIAWKNGLFDFTDADLASVLRQISRWYDVDVEYPDGVPERVFGGKMDKSLTLSQVLEILKELEVRFVITADRKLIVKP